MQLGVHQQLELLLMPHRVGERLTLYNYFNDSMVYRVYLRPTLSTLDYFKYDYNPFNTTYYPLEEIH